MTFSSLLVHDVTITRAGSTTDRYGDVIPDWSTASSSSVKGWVSQQSRSEVLDGREAQVSGWVAFFPAGTDVTGHDRVVWEGTTFEVAGPVNPAWSPRLDGVHHVECQLSVVEG